MAKAKTQAASETAEKNEDVNEPAAEAATSVTEGSITATTKTAPAKAGKRSKKAQDEADKAEAKAQRKQATAEQAADKATAKLAGKAAAPRPKRTSKNPAHAHGKRWRAAKAQIEAGKHYDLAEAVELVQKFAPTKFDASLELHINLGIDPRQSDQQVRTATVLPAGSGKAVRVAVIADNKLAESAKSAGADLTDADKIEADIAKGKFNFDVLITTPDRMPALAKHAKVLGPKGLMPSPKAGTVTTDPAAAVTEIKRGKAEIKTDSAGIVHLAFGKASFNTDDLVANTAAVLNAIAAAKPAATKGTYIKGVAMSASMSPSVRLDVAAALKAAKA